MEDKTKNQILFMLVALSVACLIMTLTANKIASKAQQERDEERYRRFTAEESLNNAKKQVNTLESEIATLRDRIQSVQTILDEGKNQTSDLKIQLENMTKTKEVLEKRIEELRTVSPQPSHEVLPVPESEPAPAPVSGQ